jgi:hypothetical protein
VLRLIVVSATVALLAVPAASAQTTKLTPVENAWAVPVVNLMKSLSGRVGAIGKQVSDPAILTRGSKAQGKLIVTLANIITCGEKLKRDGAPPTARLKPFYDAIKSACSYYTTGSHNLAKGIGKAVSGQTVGAALIKQGTSDLRHGSGLLAVAVSRLAALA